MATRQRVVCRVCGEWGYEDASDPCPGLCPRCFNRVLYEATDALLLDVQDETLSAPQLSDRHEARLRDRGLSDSALRWFRQQADALLAGLAEDGLIDRTRQDRGDGGEG